MKIIVSQQDKKILIKFKDKKFEESFIVAKSDKFLDCVDKLVPHCGRSPAVWKNARLEFDGIGLLTERIIRVIILGLSF